MKPKCTSIVALILLGATGSVFGASGEVRITAETAGRSVEADYAAGDVVPVTFYISGEPGIGFFGVEFEIAARARDVRITDVSFNRALSQVVGEPEPELPARRFKTVRTQPLDSIDHRFGADGEPVPFATVELEMRSIRPIESAVTVSARGSLLGDAPGRTVVLEASTTAHHRGRGTNQLTILNQNPDAPPVTDAAEATPWTRDVASVTLEVLEPGTRTPVTSLVASRTYELHYAATGGGAFGYALYTVAPSTDPQLVSVVPPSRGPWADTGLFSVERAGDAGSGPAPAPGYREGYYRVETVRDLVLPSAEATAEDHGHLFSFVAAEVGELILEFHMWQPDYRTLNVVEMQTDLVLAVEEDWSTEGAGS